MWSTKEKFSHLLGVRKASGGVLHKARGSAWKAHRQIGKESKETYRLWKHGL